VALAESGQRVLAVSTDPAHSLGDAFGRSLGPRPRAVPVRRGSLRAVELDADAALEARSERYVRDIFEQLRPVSVASRANKPIGDKMIMNAAFLVAREKESAFDAKVKQIGARHGALTFKYTGPWPPYNFVNIRRKLERAREGE
jgi:hypothetical protein